MTRIDLLTEASHAEIDHEGIPGVEGGGGGGGPVELAYVEKTSSTSITATAEASADEVVSAGAVSFDGDTTVIITFYAPGARPRLNGSAGDAISIFLYDGSSSIGRLISFVNPAGEGDNKPVTVSRRLKPSAASHTYSVRGTVNAGEGSVAAGAGGVGNLMPAYIRIETVPSPVS